MFRILMTFEFGNYFYYKSWVSVFQNLKVTTYAC
jgi:hypothetical protein